MWLRSPTCSIGAGTRPRRRRMPGSAPRAGVTYPVVTDPWWGLQYRVSSKSANRLVALLAGGAGASGIVAVICSGSIVAVPCLGLPTASRPGCSSSGPRRCDDVMPRDVASMSTLPGMVGPGAVHNEQVAERLAHIQSVRHRAHRRLGAHPGCARSLCVGGEFHHPCGERSGLCCCRPDRLAQETGTLMKQFA